MRSSLGLNPANAVIDGFDALTSKDITPFQFKNQAEINHSIAGVVGELAGTTAGVIGFGAAFGLFRAGEATITAASWITIGLMEWGSQKTFSTIVWQSSGPR